VLFLNHHRNWGNEVCRNAVGIAGGYDCNFISTFVMVHTHGGRMAMVQLIKNMPAVTIIAVYG
jgi:hypothetical protein